MGPTGGDGFAEEIQDFVLTVLISLDSLSNWKVLHNCLVLQNLMLKESIEACNKLKDKKKLVVKNHFKIGFLEHIPPH